MMVFTMKWTFFGYGCQQFGEVQSDALNTLHSLGLISCRCSARGFCSIYVNTSLQRNNHCSELWGMSYLGPFIIFMYWSLSIGWYGLGFCSKIFLISRLFNSSLAKNLQRLFFLFPLHWLKTAVIWLCSSFSCITDVPFLRHACSPRARRQRASVSNKSSLNSSRKESWPGEWWSVSELMAAQWINEFQAIHWPFCYCQLYWQGKWKADITCHYTENRGHGVL